MRPSRIIKHLGNFVFALSFLLLIYFATLENDVDNVTIRGNLIRGHGGKNLIVRQSIFGENEYDDQRLGNQWNSQIHVQSEDSWINISKSEREYNFSEEVVVVVVAAQESFENSLENIFVETLEAPEKPEELKIEDKDMLRENDVIEGDLIIDKSDDLLTSLNSSHQSIGDTRLYEIDSFESVYYTVIELLPTLKKPPSDVDAPGEFGHPFTIPMKTGIALGPLMAQGFRRHGFNTIVSDIISPHRNLGDKREKECKEKKYRKPLPSVSVIICFQNEAYSVLRRTLYSVLETVPALLLEEIILIDDNSRIEYSSDALQHDVRELSSIVTLIKSPNTLGVAKARLLGLKKARGKAIAFLDSHCECYEGWIEPLLERIRDNSTTIALPVIEIIDKESFAFSVTPMKMVQRGGFDWTLTYRWIAPSRARFDDPRADIASPIATPAMSGGVFVADRVSFLEMGSYDEGMNIWGAENLEISFKTWMCGGRLEIVPCSHVGHIFRNRAPEAADLETVIHNKRRVAEIWLDEYKDIFYTQLPYANEIKEGNVTARINLRKNLRCESFKWYLENVYPELYIPELNPRHSGALCCSFGAQTKVCLDTHNNDAIPGRLLCVDTLQKDSTTQHFDFTKQDELRQTGSRDICLGSRGAKIEVQRCSFPLDREKIPDYQRWNLTKDNTVVNVGTGTCLTASTTKVWLEECNLSNKIRQSWKWI